MEKRLFGISFSRTRNSFVNSNNNNNNNHGNGRKSTTTTNTSAVAAATMTTTTIGNSAATTATTSGEVNNKNYMDNYESISTTPSFGARSGSLKTYSPTLNSNREGASDSPMPSSKNFQQQGEQQRQHQEQHDEVILNRSNINGILPNNRWDKMKFEEEFGNGNFEGKEEEDRFQVFEHWLIQNSVEFSGLYLKQYSKDCRGVHAARKIEQGSSILSVPLKCLITDRMGRTLTAAGRTLFAQTSTISAPNLIAVVLYILETSRDPNCFFQPYYAILPKDYSNFPIFWDNESLKYLEGSPILKDIAERRAVMLNDYRELCHCIPWFQETYSLEEFLQIRSAVGSRNFGILVDNEKQTALVPFADMLNHLRPRETSWTFENSSQCFTITSLTGLDPGQQVMDSYGKKCVSKFFLHYGFAVEVNREEDGKCQNELPIKIELDQYSELFQVKLAFLGPSRIRRTFRISMNYEDRSTSDAFSYLRVIVANEAELDGIVTRAASSHAANGGILIPYYSARNEAAALTYLEGVMKKHIAQYPRTIEEVDRILSDYSIAKPFSNLRTALVVIRAELEIAHFWIHVSETVGKILSNAKTLTGLLADLRSLPRETFQDRDTYAYARYSIIA